MRQHITFALICGFALLSAANSASAEDTTDVSRKIADELVAVGKVKVTHETKKLVPFWFYPKDKSGRTTNEPVEGHHFVPITETDDEFLAASNLRVSTTKPFQFGTPIVKALPSSVVVDSITVYNKGTGTATAGGTFTGTFQRSESVTLTKTVTNSITVSASTQNKLSDIWTVTLGVVVGQTNSSATATSQGSSDTVTLSNSSSYSLPAGQSIQGFMETVQTDYEVPFTLEVVVEGDLSKNDAGKSHISEVLSEQQRTFTISGVLKASDCSRSTTVSWAVPESDDGPKTLVHNAKVTLGK